MAIIIPSKNIYDAQVSKINDNFFTEFKIDQVSPKLIKQVNQSIFADDYNINYGSDTEVVENETKESYEQDRTDGDYYGSWYVYLDNKVYYKYFEISIPILNKSRYVEKDYKDDMPNSGWQYTLNGKKITGNTSATIAWSNNAVPTLGNISIKNKKTEFGNIEIPKKQVTISLGEAIVSGVSQLFPELIDYSKNEETINFTIKIPVAYKIETLTSERYMTAAESVGTGYYENYKGESVSITINGDTIVFDTTRNTVSIGYDDLLTAKVKSYKVEENELIQDQNGYMSPNGIASQIVYQEALLRYLGGLETMTLRCPITNYYKSQDDFSAVSTNEVAISPYSVSNSYETYPAFTFDESELGGNDVLSENGESEVKIPVYLPMTFQLHDIVMPMSFNKWNAQTQKWEDQPRSFNEGGYPKLFEVVGVKITSGGATWQELDLVEWQYSARTT